MASVVNGHVLHLHACNCFNAFFRAIFLHSRRYKLCNNRAINRATVLNICRFSCHFVRYFFLCSDPILLCLLCPAPFSLNGFLFLAFSAFFRSNALLLCAFGGCLCIGFSSGRGFEFCPALFFSLSARAFFCFAFDLRFSFPLCSFGLLNSQALKLFCFRFALLCCFQSYF